MKTLRLFTIVILAVLVLSTWAPAPVYAKGSDTLVTDLAKIKLARLRVTNKTGGTMYISLSGAYSYSFAASSQGRTTFDAVIQPGKYTIKVTSSACSGQLTYRKKVKGGTVSLPPIVCKH